MNNNFLKVTTILCSLALLPGISSAKTENTPTKESSSCKSTLSDVIISKDERGYTALHYAAYHNNKDLAIILIDNGANLTLQTNMDIPHYIALQ